MLKVIIVENNAKYEQYIQSIIKHRIMINPTPNCYDDMVISLQSDNPFEIKKKIKDENYLAILDIELGKDVNGIDIAEMIRREANFAEIIFITAYNEYLPYTISRRIEPLDYISKSDSITSITERLQKDIDEAYSRYQSFLDVPQKQYETFVYEPLRGVKRQINLEDLFYVESIKYKSRRLRIVGKNLRVEYSGTLNQIKKKQLIRISQSAIINPKNVIEFDKKNRIVFFSKDHSIKCNVSYRKVTELNKFFSNNS